MGITSYKANKTIKYKVRFMKGYDKLTGKQQYITKQGFTSKFEAEDYLRVLEQAYNRTGINTLELAKEAVRASEDTLKESNAELHKFKDVFNQWFESYQYTVKESTWVTTKRNFDNHILPFLGRKNISDIDDDYIQKVVNKWYKSKLRNYKRFFNSTSLIFQYAKRKHYLTTNPCENIILPRMESHLHLMSENYYTKEELQKFLQCVYESSDFKVYAFFRLLAFSGMRKGELLALTWSDVHFKEMTLTIDKTQSRGKDGINVQTAKTSESMRTVWLDKKTISILKEWKKEQKSWLFQRGYSQPTNQLVFQNGYNTMYQPIKPRLWMLRVTDEYNLKRITIHGFRHTYATIAYEAGLDVKQLQHQLGHRNIQTTLDIYTAITNRQKSDIADKYSDYLQF